MSFIFAEKTQLEIENRIIHGISIYGDTKIELSGAVKANWPPVARRTVNTYGMSKVAIPDPKLCISFAGNNLQYVSRLFAWMETHSPFSTNCLVDVAYRLHLEPDSHDDIEFIICETDVTPSGRIVCIKNGTVSEDNEIAWIGSQQTFFEMQRIRLSQAQAHTDTLALFAQAIRSSADDSVGGFIINAALREGTFHFNDYLFTQVYRSQTLLPGESMQLIDSREDGGYTIEAYEEGGQPCLYFPQINRAILYTNRYRYKDEAPLDPSLRYFYLPMLIDTTTGKCLEV